MSNENKFKETLLDYCVVHWVYVKEHDTNPHKAIGDLLAQTAKEALDPQISDAAQALWQAGYEQTKEANNA